MSIAAPAAQSFPWLEKLIGGARNVASGIGTGAAAATGTLAGLALLLSTTSTASREKDELLPRDADGRLILPSGKDEERRKKEQQAALSASTPEPPPIPPEPPLHAATDAATSRRTKEGDSTSPGDSTEQQATQDKEITAQPRAKSLEDILAPGGKHIGAELRGAGAEVKTLSPTEFQAIQKELWVDAQPTRGPITYRGAAFKRPDGTVIGIRISRKHGTTIDIIESNTKSIPKGYKYHRPAGS